MSDQSLREHLSNQLADIQTKGLYKRERQLQGPQGSAIRVDDREVINFCANNYLGLANHPAIVEAAHGGAAPLRLRHGVGALHLRHPGHPQEARSRHRPLPRQGRRHPLQLLLGRQRRTVRDDPRRRGRHPQRRAEPRQHHRRHPPVQGEALPLQELRHGRPGKVPEGSSRLPVPADRHRRRLLDGRLAGAAARHLRPGRQARRHRHGGRQPRHRHPRRGGRGTPEQLGVLDRIDIITSTLGKTLGGAAGGFTCARQRSRRLPAAALAAVPLLQRPAAADRPRRAEGAGAGRATVSDLRDRLHANANGCVQALEARASRSSRASIRSCR